MEGYKYYAPGCTYFGYGCLELLEEGVSLYKWKRGLIVTDKTLVQIGLVKKVTTVLEKAKVEYCIFDEVCSNPTYTVVEDCLECAKKYDVDFVLSIGGGSAHDTAKAVAMLYTNGGTLDDYTTVCVSEKDPLPLVAVNTTAGTASECTMDFVVVDEKKQKKFGLSNIRVIPTISIDDHALMMGLSPSLTSGPGMDALTHAIEAYVSKHSFLLTEQFSLIAIKMIFNALKEAVITPNEKNREEMAVGQYIAGLAFGNAGCGLAHSMSHQLSALYNLPHGLCNAIVLPETCRINCKSEIALKKYAKIAEFVFPLETLNLNDKEKADFLIYKIEELSKSVGTFVSLHDLNVKENDIGILAEKTMVDVSLRHNYYQPSQMEVEELFRKLM